MFKRFKVFAKVLIRFIPWPPGIVLSCVVITGLFSLLIVLFQGPAIEKELTGNVSAFLQGQGFERINVQANGRDIILRGKVSSDSAEFTALGYARSVHGVRIVKSDLGLMPLRLPHLLIIRGLDYELRIEGEVSSADGATSLVDLIVAKIEHGDVNQSIQVSPEVTDPDWVSVLPAILDEVNQLDSLEMEIGAGQAMIGGLIKDKSNYRVVIQRLSQFLDSENIELVNGIGIVSSGFSNEIESDLAGADVATEKLTMEEEPPIVEKVDSSEAPVVGSPEENASEGEEAEGAASEDEVIEGNEMVPEIVDSEVLEQEAIPENRTVVEKPSESEPEPLTIDQCQRRLNEIMFTYPINFSPNKVDLPVNSSITIEEIAETYGLCPTFALIVQGHTDSSGKSEVNLRLSQLRAQSVVENLLITGIPESRIKATGFGASNPVADNNTEEGRRKNRRIELKIH
jgi:outer membrane protein OmpA-like peptidoglycan-associated protein